MARRACCGQAPKAQWHKALHLPFRVERFPARRSFSSVAADNQHIACWSDEIKGNAAGRFLVPIFAEAHHCRLTGGHPLTVSCSKHLPCSQPLHSPVKQAPAKLGPGWRAAVRPLPQSPSFSHLGWYALDVWAYTHMCVCMHAHVAMCVCVRLCVCACACICDIRACFFFNYSELIGIYFVLNI